MYTCAEQNQPVQVRSSREGVAWNYSKVVLQTMSQLASHYGFHDLKTWLTWWQSIGLVKLYSSEDKWVPNCPVNPDDSRFCSTFPSTWRELACSSNPSPPRCRVHWWTTCAAVAQISRHSQKIAMAWRDACENYNIYIYDYILQLQYFQRSVSRLLFDWGRSFALPAQRNGKSPNAGIALTIHDSRHNRYCW